MHPGGHDGRGLCRAAPPALRRAACSTWSFPRAALAVADFATYRNPEMPIIAVTARGFFSDGAIFELIPNARGLLRAPLQLEDMAALVEHYGSKHARPRVPPRRLQAADRRARPCGSSQSMRRSDRHDPRRIDRLVAHVIVPGDMVEIHRLRHAGHLVELARIAPEVRIVDQPPAVALEVAVIDRVEAEERGREPPVRLGQPVAHQVAAAAPAAPRASRASRRPPPPPRRRPPGSGRSRRDRRRC